MHNKIKIFKSKEERNKTILILLGLLILFIVLSLIFRNYFFEIEKLKDFILSFELYAPLIFLGLQIVQCLIPPIPGQVIVMLGGFLFGPIYGFLLSIIGAMIGSFIAFILSKKLGLKFVDKVITKEAREKLHNLTNNSSFLFFLIYLLPGFPDDFLPYIAGLGQMKTKVFLLITFYGRFLGYLLLSFSGYFILNSLLISLVFLCIFAILGILFYIFRHKLQKLF